MYIGGYLPFSLTDFPGRVAAVVFTQGCNFRCPFCHNPDLIPLTACNRRTIPVNDVLAWAYCRRKQIDGVVLTGGEPTIQRDLSEVARSLKAMGLAVKLDTNGSQPDIVNTLIRHALVDFVAMDIKGPFNAYSRLVGIDMTSEPIQESIRIVASSGIAHEFRTTAVPLLTKADLGMAAAAVPRGSPHRFQPYKPPPTMA